MVPKFRNSQDSVPDLVMIRVQLRGDNTGISYFGLVLVLKFVVIARSSFMSIVVCRRGVRADSIGIGTPYGALGNLLK